jgi:hypothetical protein
MAIILEIKHAHPAAGGVLVENMGRAFVSLKGGLDVELYVTFPFDAQGLVKLVLQPRDVGVMREVSEAKNVPLKALYSRRYTASGGEKVHWIDIGRGMITDQGASIELYYQPPVDHERRMRFILRPLEQPQHHVGGPVQPQAPQQPAYPPQGQQPGYYGQPRPQQPAQGQQSSYRPQHRDGLGQGGQQSLSEQPQRPPYKDDSDIPF